MADRFLYTLLLAVLSMLAAIAFALPSVNQDDLTTDYAKQIIRQSKVAEIQSLLNTNVAPCDDFYSYACGNWHRHNPAQLLRNIMTDTFQLISTAFNRRLQRLLQSGEMRNNLEERLQGFYQSCLQLHREDHHYLLSLQHIYREYGEMPVLAAERWNASDFSWWRTVAQMSHKYGQQMILSVDVMPDIKNRSVNRVYLGPPNGGRLGNSHILSTLEDASTAEEMKQYLGLSSHLAKTTAKELNEFDRTLSTGIISRGHTLEEDLTLYTIEELEEKFNSNSTFDIKEFLAVALGEDNVPEQIYVYSDTYVENTLATIKSTPPAVVANYVLWELVNVYLIDAKPGEMTKWCTDQSRNYFGKLADHMVYERYRSAEAEADVYNIWEQIRSTFRQHLAGDKLDWISNNTRQSAIEKLDRMQLIINAYDNEDFEQTYGNFTIDKFNYVVNVQQLLKAKAKQTLRRLHEPPAALEDTVTLSFTPAYNIMENNITIPVALLQPRYFWDVNYPQALKYSTLGYLLAHEMIHGFDDDGRNYDANGTWAPWWDQKSRYEYEEKRKCFQAQYHEYKYDGHHLPDSTDQSENIADNAGIKLAFTVYKKWLQHQSTEILQRETFDGLDLTNEQLFFVGFAQLWCDDVQSWFKTTVASSDNHAPSMYRIIGSLSNFQEFSWVFNCSQRAPMDPEFKCAIY